MIKILAESETVFFVAFYKPILFLIFLGGWAWLATFVDKDAQYFFLKRRLWNGIQIGAAIFGFLLWLMIPFFWVGMPLAILIITGAMGSYAYYRNGEVPEKSKWRFSLESLKNRMSEAERRQALKAASVTLMSDSGEKFDVPIGDDPRVEAHNKLERVLDFALPRGANRIDLNVNAQRAVMIVAIDGVKYPQAGIAPNTGLTIIEYLKASAGMDLVNRRKRQTGHVWADATELGKHMLRLTTQGSTREMMMTIQLDPEEQGLLGLDQLGLLKSQMEQLDPVIKDEQALAIIVTSPPQNGQTTALYNLIRLHDAYTENIVTLEDKVEFELEGVTQETIEPNTPAPQIAKKLASVLRQDPQVVMLEKIEEGELSQMVAQAAADVRMYFGMRYNDTFAALGAWLKATGDPEQAAESLGAIVATRLVRKLCLTCRIPFTPDPKALKMLNLPPEQVGNLFKHSGRVVVKGDQTEQCPTCMGLGYQGRIGVFEVMALDDAARALLAQGKLDPLRHYLRKNRMMWLQEAALSKAVEGITSIQEITRALSQDADKPMAPPPEAEPEPVA